MENHARNVGPGETRDTASKRGDRTRGFGNFFQGGGAGNSTVWVGDVGHCGDICEESRGDRHRVPLSDHGEESEAAKIQEIGDAWIRRREQAAVTELAGIHIKRWQATLDQ